MEPVPKENTERNLLGLLNEDSRSRHELFVYIKFIGVTINSKFAKITE